MAPVITVHNTTAQTKKKPPDTIHKWFPYTQYSSANDNKLQSQKTRQSVKKGTIFPVFLVLLAPYRKEQHKEIRDSCVRRDCCERLLLHVVSFKRGPKLATSSKPREPT